MPTSETLERFITRETFYYDPVQRVSRFWPI